jgi:hypothetical protein
VKEATRQTRNKIGDDIEKMPESMLNIISDYIKEPHVHDNMQKISMHEHGSKQCPHFFTSEELTGNKCKFNMHLTRWIRELPNKHNNVRSQYYDRKILFNERDFVI